MPGGRPRTIKLHCFECDKPFRTYPALYYHNRMHHDEPRFECSHCGQMFQTSARRGTHLNKVLQEELAKTEKRPLGVECVFCQQMECVCDPNARAYQATYAFMKSPEVCRSQREAGLIHLAQSRELHAG